VTDVAERDALDLDAVRQQLRASRRPDRLRPMGLERIVLGDDALPALVDTVRAVARPGPVRIVIDATPMVRDGVDLKRHVLDLLTPLGAEVVTLGEQERELHADLAAVSQAEDAIEGAGCVVAVGSGTVCDIAKRATEREGGIPFVVVQTACSVNAFSDDLAVLLIRGAKRTVPSRWPDALIVDLGVIAAAPVTLNRAGVGELCAMFTAPLDWQLASLLGLDDGYDEAVVALFRDGGEALEQVAAGVALADRASLRWLSERMTLSGLAMGAAGRTAPVSGSEHAISHLLDMAALNETGRTGLHGAQVGVATVVVAALWQDVLERFDAERLRAAPPAPDAARDRITTTFAGFDPSGEMADECWRLYRRKLAAWTEQVAERAAFVATWPDVRRSLSASLVEPERIVHALTAAGAPTRFSELDPPVAPDLARWAVSAAHLLRDRFGVLDLVDLGGAWTDADVERVLERAAVAGGGR
jgi:glycerol-1-phosphate dehydrogenase [NAD(P)+]